ncbi:sensor histidine kinase [Clostridium sp. Marseille-P2415]|uniref:sensor histidine kinase n=1 Tax=Clostridium sp. Marseille-P2415 TaxID=1805471 RepID=UPI0009883957|nr:sensor histidine kinase [Clostridium sp. Marseille-P2415]
MMGNELFTVSRLFFCGIDVYMLYRFFKAIFQEKWKGKKRVLSSLIITLIIFFENSIGSMPLNFVTVPLVFYIYVILSFNISFSNGIAYTIIYFAIFAGGKEVSFELLYRLLSGILPFYIPPWFTSGGIYFLLIEYLAGFLFLLYIEKFIKKLKISNNNNFSWYLLIVPAVSLMISSSFLYIDFPDSIIMQIFMCGGAFLLFFANAAIFVILERYTEVMNKVKYAELYTVKRDMENEHFQNILKINERYQCYIHDINAYFNSFRVLALNDENKKIVEIIDELSGKIQRETSNVIYSGNPVLNAILTERVSKAKEKGIKLSLFIEKFLKIDFISDADMISMLGNILDNALEAAAKCSPEERRVDVKLFMGNNYFLIFHIENSYAVAVKKEGSRLLSTKADSRHHGLGIGIVMTLAEKYGGTLNLEEKDDMFVTTLTISTCSGAENANFGTQRV